MIIERGLFVSIVALVTLLWFEFAFPDSGRIVGIVLTPIILLTMLLAPNLNQPSFGFIYLTIFILFHMGLTFTVGLGVVSSVGIIDYISRWYYDDLSRKAEFLCSIGAASFAVGYFLIRSSTKKYVTTTVSFYNSKIGGIVGSVFLVLAVPFWFYWVIRFGALGSYDNFNTARLNPQFTTLVNSIHMAIGLGVCLAALTSDRLRRFSIALFLLWAAVAFPLGLRGEVLFPASALLAVYSAKYKINWLFLGALLLAIAVAASVVRDTRNTGGDVDAESVTANPFDAVAELGGSLRPVYEVLKWEDEGDEFIWGASYYAPFERLFLRIFPVKKRLAAEDDERLMNILIVSRAGSYGFSPVAEGYRNFAIPGVMLVLFVFGLMVRIIDIKGVGWRFNAYAILVYILLVMNIRNAFTWVLGNIVIWTVILATIELFLKKYQDAPAPAPAPTAVRNQQLTRP